MIKSFVRLFYWILFFLKTGYLKNTHSIIEVGAGKSTRIQTVSSLFFYKGKFLSIDHDFIPLQKETWLSFKPEFLKIDFFKFKSTADLLIFDHSIDDILAGMLDENQNQKKYNQIMDNTKLFDYSDQKFINKIKQILSHAKTLISPNGKIIISNYLTSHDYDRGTVDIALELLPQLSKIAKQLNLKVDLQSNRFLVLKNNDS